MLGPVEIRNPAAAITETGKATERLTTESLKGEAGGRRPQTGLNPKNETGD
jgi:hypothetical protein